MRNLIVALVAVLLLPAAAEAQAAVDIRVNLPVVLPRLVVVSPGVQVVPDFEEEVFLVNGFYWVRHDNGWYRSRSHRGGWMLAGPRLVPAQLGRLPPGKYKHWKPAHGGGRSPAPAAYHGGGKGGGKHDNGNHGGGKHKGGKH
jgi:hypothetical protein